MPDAKHNFEKAALAVLLCTKSDLGNKWREDPSSVTEQDLEDFGFSLPFRLKFLEPLRNMGRTPPRPEQASVAEFTKVANALQFHIWSGDPPHPPKRMAEEIVEGLIAKGKTSTSSP